MSEFGLNATYVEILRAQWELDPLSVPEDWRIYFGEAKEQLPVLPNIKEEKKAPQAMLGDRNLLVGIARKIVDNMEESLQIPTATSSRDIPVKVLEENRAIINDYLENDARPRCSFTHLIAYALVRAMDSVPVMNNGFVREKLEPVKLTRVDVNLGLAIDLPARDGGRTLVVPSLKSCQKMDFWTFFTSYNDIIERARLNKLKPDDFAGTSVTLTNPGGIGTVASNPRLMPGQGTIFATGRIGFSAQYEATSSETLHALGIGKIMTVTSTYDHRVIQGAESGRFLAKLHQLLIGEEGFYEDVFRSLKIPHYPYQLKSDQAVVLGQRAESIQTERAMRVSQLIHAYRVRGYLLAHVDPLHLIPRKHSELDLQNYGLTIWDLDREFDTFGVLKEKTAPLRDILRQLRHTYCRRMGVEYMYINDVAQKTWLQRRVEHERDTFTPEDKKAMLSKLLQVEGFEQFLHKRYVGHKRFSIEGAEVAIAMLSELLDGASDYGMSDVMIGMAHRGRLNVLANVVGKPYEAIFAEFEDLDKRSSLGSGDVKYHLGAQGVHKHSEHELRVELACNPSHLEAVNPVVLGQVRAQQDLVADRERKKIMPVLLHGDAAFAMQGVVYETLQCADLQGYRTGGTVHIVVNNQIGYTTGPEKARSSLNCSDIARGLFIPVLRVNGDDPEACIRAIRIALEYRMRFALDVVIDVVCYRRYGHNEGDEPAFTQPILYAAIQKHPSVATLYAELLVRRAEITPDLCEKMRQEHQAIFENAHAAVREKGREAFSDEYLPMAQRSVEIDLPSPSTAVSADTLKAIAEKVTNDPEGITLHPRLKAQVLERRRAMVFDGKPGIDFGMAEILAYGSLLLEGVCVRMSGQDCGRGTFAHRHAALYDVNDGKLYIPLNHVAKTQDQFQIYDSPLSEEAILGFEYGYSVNHPKALVIWEAQFGDFFNGAQVQVDQFIASSEAKWHQRSRLTLFLPHGYDGQGPEHSSARIERFLQLCAEDNLRVVNCSTPAQLFHVLRRQAMTPKKPLIVFSHKSLLRAEDASSQLSELSEGAFQNILDDHRNRVTKKTKRVILCSGKIYWELDRYRVEKNLGSDVSVVRVEQLYPLSIDVLRALIEKASLARDIVWLQEEPENCGAYRYIERLLRMAEMNLRYIGRTAAASPATGSPKSHRRQQQAIIEAAFAPATAKMTNVEVV